MFYAKKYKQTVKHKYTNGLLSQFQRWNYTQKLIVLMVVVE